MSDGKKKEEMFLTEKVIAGKLEPIAICYSLEKVIEIMGQDEGLVTKMCTDVEYSEGVGVCSHIHFKDGILDSGI